MMRPDLARLHTLIAAYCPIEGVRIGRADDRSTWGFTAKPEATAEQLAAGLAALEAYDPEAPTADDVRAECQRRIMALVGARNAEHLAVKMANAQREAARYLNLLQSGHHLDEAQSARRTVLMTLDEKIEELRAFSNALEALEGGPGIPKDFTDGRFWGAIG